jgi:hypothetical protein
MVMERAVRVERAPACRNKDVGKLVGSKLRRELSLARRLWRIWCGRRSLIRISWTA